MPKKVNGPQNKEQLKLMVDVVKREADLAQDLLNSYQNDLTQLESNTSISNEEKASKRVFLETAIKESEELLNIRQKQLKAIDPMKSGKKVGQARRDVWSDTTLESRGMNSIIAEMSAGYEEQKHQKDVEKTRQGRQDRSEAVRNAAATLATAAEKLAAEKNDETFEVRLEPKKEIRVWKIPILDKEVIHKYGHVILKEVTESEYKNFWKNTIPRPDYIEGSDKWFVTGVGLLNPNYDYVRISFQDRRGYNYDYLPDFDNVYRLEYNNESKMCYTKFYNKVSKKFEKIPFENNITEVITNEKGLLYFDQVKQQWLQVEPDREKSENTLWQIPTYDENGNLIFDENGKRVFRQVSEEEYEDFLDNGRRTDAETAAFAEKIKNNIMAQEDAEQSHEDKNIEMNPKEIGELALEEQKTKFRGLGPNRSDIILQNFNEPKQIKLNWFQKIKLWVMRLFNKNYQLPEARNNGFYLSEDIKKYKQGALDKSKNIEEQKNKEKRIIRGYSKTKKFFKDNKKKLLALTALSLATIGMVFGINALKEYNKNIIEQKAAEAQREADAEAKRAQEEQQALEEAAKKQEQEEKQQAIEQQDKLVAHDADTLTTGSISRQYVAHQGLEYTADSTGRGTRGTLAKDTIVEIFNRAIVKENEDGTKTILLTSNGKTWEDYAKDTGMSIDEIQNMLKQDNTYEMAAIQVGEANHNIFNTYGWVKTTDLDESSKGTENLKNSEITFGDNTEILQQLQQNEKDNQGQESER